MIGEKWRIGKYVGKGLGVADIDNLLNFDNVIDPEDYKESGNQRIALEVIAPINHLIATSMKREIKKITTSSINHTTQLTLDIEKQTQDLKDSIQANYQRLGPKVITPKL